VAFGSTGGLDQWDIVRISDVALEAGLQTLRIRMLDGGFNLNKLTFEQATGTGVEDGENPKRFNLLPNYPNPFNPDTVISYTVPQAAFVTLDVFDVYGRQIQKTRTGMHTPGRYEITFDGSDLPSGTYFYRLRTPENTSIRAMTLLK
jgi:hypothetical protein